MCASFVVAEDLVVEDRECFLNAATQIGAAACGTLSETRDVRLLSAAAS